MAARTERSKALHNFRMPGDLRWANQRFLRCMKVNAEGSSGAAANKSDQSHHRRDFTQPPRSAGRDRERRRERESSSESLHGSHKEGASPPPPTAVGRRFSDDDGGIAATREKLMFDLRTATDKMKDEIRRLKDGEVCAPAAAAAALPVVASVDGEIHRPWNLRTRRAACKVPESRFISSAAAAAATNDYAVLTVDLPKSTSGFPQSRTGQWTATDRSPRLRSAGGSAEPTAGEKRSRPKFSVALSKSEIEEDFFKLVGHRPPRRPKKRAKFVQKQLDTLFPGLWLTEITPDMYKVNEAAQ